MQIKITRVVGKVSYTFDVSNEKGYEALAEASLFSSMPDKCGMKDCNSENIHLSSNKAKGFTFVKMICDDCNARAQLGQYKDGTGYFWKNWEAYNPSKINQDAKGDLRENSEA
jgi:hypothetical protein